MHKLTKYSQKMKVMYIGASLIICLCMVFVFPWFYSVHKEQRFYMVVVNGKTLGVVDSEYQAKCCMRKARLSMNKEAGQIVSMNPELEIYPQNKAVNEVVTETVLEERIYETLKECNVTTQKNAFVINIDGETVILETKEEVVELLNRIASQYDKNGQFSLELIMNQNSEYSSYTVGAKSNSAKGGLENLCFEENVEVVEMCVEESQLTTVDKAFESLTKLKERHIRYEIEPLDTMYWIAMHFDTNIEKIMELNEYLDDEATIYIGDELVIPVMEPDLNVVITKKESYTEKYSAEEEFVENDKKYTSYQEVIQKGKKGKRKVVANVRYKNGVRYGSDILEEEIIKKAVPQITEVGTQVEPTYVKPLSMGTISSTFGARWGTVHKGIDWACSQGTAIYASCGGTVVQAGWRGTYGYCVEIAHPDGNNTRYAHLSSVLVSAGDTVKQYDKIALSGNTGDRTGPHLHFEILVNGTQVDPLSLLQ